MINKSVVISSDGCSCSLGILTLCFGFVMRKRKVSDSVLWKKPLYQQKVNMAPWQHLDVTKKSNYTAIMDRLRTVRWSNYSHPTGLNFNCFFSLMKLRTGSMVHCPSAYFSTSENGVYIHLGERRYLYLTLTILAYAPSPDFILGDANAEMIPWNMMSFWCIYVTDGGFQNTAGIGYCHLLCCFGWKWYRLRVQEQRAENYMARLANISPYDHWYDGHWFRP